MSTLFDPLAAVPPVPPDEASSGPSGGSACTPDYSGAFTMLPSPVSREAWSDTVLPALKKRLSPELFRFVRQTADQILGVQETLRLHRTEFEKILGRSGFSLNWVEREAHSSDSMEYRCLTSEALAVIYTERQLRELVSLCTRLDVPMVPYGAGAGYNMGVVPMAGALTVSLKGLCRIGPVEPLAPDEARNYGNGKRKITAEAGASWTDVIAAAEQEGFILRCRPNTPRSAVGGIVGTGSHAGMRVQDVVLEGQAVIHGGRLFRFAPTDSERELLPQTSFLTTNKFWGVGEDDLAAIRRAADLDERGGVGTPFLPMSLFVGAEGCTGIISRVTLLLDPMPARARTAALVFADEGEAFAFARRVKALPPGEQPPFFEAVARIAIETYLLEKFPHRLRPGDEAYLVFDLEGGSDEEVDRRTDAVLGLAPEAACRASLSPIRRPGNPCSEAAALKAVREELPKLLRTKCKTDPEIDLDHVEQAIRILAQPLNPLPGDGVRTATVEKRPAGSQGPDSNNSRGGSNTTLTGNGKHDKPRLSSLIFGHLTPPKTAIIHWNIGGFDIYREEEARSAWTLLSARMNEIARLDPSPGAGPTSTFSGEHGIAGKAPLLFLGHLSEDRFEHLMSVKRAVDPKDLFNPRTIFLRSRLSRQVHARLLAHSHDVMTAALAEASPAAAHAIEQAKTCTRCNACKICPVIDAEVRLRREAIEQRSTGPASLIHRRGLLLSKRDLVLSLEKLVFHAAASGADLGHPRGLPHELAEMLADVEGLLAKCFYCRRCDERCPVDIDLHGLVGSLLGLEDKAGRGPAFPGSSWLYDRLLGPDPLRGLYYKTAGIFQRLGAPAAAMLRRSGSLPDWMKTYLAVPPFQIRRYRPARYGVKMDAGDNFLVIGRECVDADGPPAFIRFRGCMDSFARGRASRSADRVYGCLAGLTFADLEADLCCGFPHRAAHRDGPETEMAAAAVAELLITAGRLVKHGAPPALTVFSNCPTCQEELRLSLNRFDEDMGFRGRTADLVQARLRWDEVSTALDGSGSALSLLRVRDAAEPVAERLVGHGGPGEPGALPGMAGPDDNGSSQPGEDRLPGLKVPCHNTPEATAAQLALLEEFFGGARAFTDCCGLSGSARFFHPRIGTEVASGLMRSVSRHPVRRLVSGCPACRDGAEIQRRIMAAGTDTPQWLPQHPASDLFTTLLGDDEFLG